MSGESKEAALRAEDFEFEEEFGAEEFIDRGKLLVNPNPGRPYLLVKGGKRSRIQPMKPFRVPSKDADWICTKAERSHANMLDQARNEEKAFVKLYDHPNMAQRVKAGRFARIEDGEIVTSTQPPPFPWIVNLDTKKGKEIYEKAKAQKSVLEALATKHKPKTVEERFEELMAEESEKLKQLDAKKEKILSGDIATETAVGKQKQIRPVLKPNLGMGKDGLVEYIKDGGINVSGRIANDVDKLLDRANKIFKSKCKFLDELGVEYEVVG